VTEEPSGQEVVSVGNALVDRTYLLSNLPEPDGGASVEAHEERPGGVEANVAAALSRFGRETGVIARLGDDDAADLVLADLDERGIDRRRVRTVPGETSAYCLVLRDRDGRRMIIGGGDSTANLRLDDDDLAYLSTASVVFASGYAPPPVIERLAAARTDGRLGRLAFDLAGEFRDLETRGLGRADLDEAVAAVDLFVGNEAAVGSYVGAQDPTEMVERLRSRGADRGAITRGTGGALLFDPDRRTSVPAFDVDVADTTGAGDAFSAGLVDAWLLRDERMEEAGQFAAAAAALNCTAPGARGRLPTPRTILEFLASQT
jgi:ribokinase/sulfofructose kinase